MFSAFFVGNSKMFLVVFVGNRKMFSVLFVGNRKMFGNCTARRPVSWHTGLCPPACHGAGWYTCFGNAVTTAEVTTLKQLSGRYDDCGRRHVRMTVDTVLS